MRPVHVRIRHDDDAAVAQLAQVEMRSDAASQRLDEIAQLLVRPQLVCGG